MTNESITTTFPFPEHWPVLAFSGGDSKEREKILAKIGTELHQKAIKILIVTDSAPKDSCSISILNAPGSQDVLYLGDGFSQTVVRGDVKGQRRATMVPDPVLHGIIASYVPLYDLILISTDTVTLIDTVKLEMKQDQNKGDLSRIVHIHREGDAYSTFIKFLMCWLNKKMQSTPTWGCVLIGGKSSRMGQPKHLLKGKNGRTWLENTVARLEEVVAKVVLSGDGEIPDSLFYLPRMVDIENVQGPMAGALSAMRWNPQVSWLVVACDMPEIRREGLHWLLEQRRVGAWGTVPRHQDTAYFEPLLAHYDFRSGPLLEQLLLSGCLRISGICNYSKIANPLIPPELLCSWRNLNTPEDLDF